MELREFAISRYGLINNDIRRKVWPILLNSNNTLLGTTHSQSNTKQQNYNVTPKRIKEEAKWKPNNAPPLLSLNSFGKNDKIIEAFKMTSKKNIIRKNVSKKPKVINAKIIKGNSKDEEVFITCDEDEFNTPMSTFHPTKRLESTKKEYNPRKTKLKMNTTNEKIIQKNFSSAQRNIARVHAYKVSIKDSTTQKGIEVSKGTKNNIKLAEKPTSPIKRIIPGKNKYNENGKQKIDSKKNDNKEISIKDRYEKSLIEDKIQIEKDILRSMNNFDFFTALNEETSIKFRTELKEIIIQLISRNRFHYYQGYNELCSVFLLILGKKQGVKAAEIVSTFLIKDFLLDSFETGVKPMLFMLNDLLKITCFDIYSKFNMLGVFLNHIIRYQHLSYLGF